MVTDLEILESAIPVVEVVNTNYVLVSKSLREKSQISSGHMKGF